MALPSLATVSDLETRLGVPAGSISGDDLARAEAALADVSALIRAEAGKVKPGTTWVDADGVTITAPDEVLVVARQAALRVYRNPEGFSGESVGGYSWQAQGPTGVYLTAEEVAQVTSAARGSTAGRNYSVRVPSAYYDPLTGNPLAMTWGLDGP